jgi:hypothetical protein
MIDAACNTSVILLDLNVNVNQDDYKDYVVTI